MSKTYKISYKTYFNERLKEVDFHGKATLPLYIQVTYSRQTMFFKSYYFELFLNPRYGRYTKGKKQGPSIDDIIGKEMELLGFISDKLKDSFTLEEFKAAYIFYAEDLCTLFEEGFIVNMFVFFFSKKLENLGKALSEGSRNVILFNLLQDMKTAFAPDLYTELAAYSLRSQPYLPVYEFMQQVKKWPMHSLSIMEWENIKTKVKFADYILSHYPNNDAGKIITVIDDWVSDFKKSKRI